MVRLSWNTESNMQMNKMIKYIHLKRIENPVVYTCFMYECTLYFFIFTLE